MASTAASLMQTLNNFIVALPSEAAPLIDALRLNRCTRARGVKLYRRDNYRLVISGVGKTAAAAAVGYIAGSEPADTRHIWLNIGIAGHATLSKGAVGIAHRIIDQATGATYYPAIAFRAPCASYSLVCYDAPNTTYADEAMCDMESSGFFAAASRFSSVEFIHSIKIISDNSDSDIAALNRTTISEMIKAHLTMIETLAELLERLAERHLAPGIALPIDTLIARWHFTATQQSQLRDIARRWALVRAEHKWPADALAHCASSREVIAHLSAALDQTPLKLLGSTAS